MIYFAQINNKWAASTLIILIVKMFEFSKILFFWGINNLTNCVQGRCPRKFYGVCPEAQANIPHHGTLGQRILYLKP